MPRKGVNEALSPEERFRLQLDLSGLTPLSADYKQQFRFHPTRRWPFDFAWPESKVAVEIQGGIWGTGKRNEVKGAHVRGKGYTMDCEKLGEAAVLGWKVIPVTPEMVDDGTALDRVRRALAPVPNPNSFNGSGPEPNDLEFLPHEIRRGVVGRVVSKRERPDLIIEDKCPVAMIRECECPDWAIQCRHRDDRVIWLIDKEMARSCGVPFLDAGYMVIGPGEVHDGDCKCAGGFYYWPHFSHSRKPIPSISVATLADGQAEFEVRGWE